MMSTPQAIEAEPFRLLRTTLQFAAVGRELRSLLVTSSVQQEGKSTTIANLAVTLARAGQRVVLVDLDLRRPAIRRLFQLKPGRGLTDVLLGRLELAEALIEVPIDSRESGPTSAVGDASGSLTLLGAGTVPPNPGELVTSGVIGAILDQLKERADIVLIDAPPILAFGDGLVLSALADAVFVCVKLPLVTRAMLNDLHRALTGAHVRALGCVITGKIPHKGGSYGYGYGYGYAAPAGDPPDAAPDGDSPRGAEQTNVT